MRAGRNKPLRQVQAALLTVVGGDQAVRVTGPDGYWVSDDPATSHPDVASIRQVLMAEPGRSLYRSLGFGILISPERWMERPGGDTPG
jgi:hypothetical protein